MPTFTARGGWWVVGQVVLLALYVAALLGADPFAPAAGAGAVRVLGAALFVLGVVIGIWSLLTLGKDLTPYPAPQAGAFLREHGPYRLVRHPMYLSIVLGALGAAVAPLNPIAFLIALVLLPFFAAKSNHEETLLLDRYAGYERYRSRVRSRIVPGIL